MKPLFDVFFSWVDVAFLVPTTVMEFMYQNTYIYARMCTHKHDTHLFTEYLI